MTEKRSYKTALMFPGQGSQFVGMGRDLYEASKDVRDLFRKAEDITNRPIRKHIFEGPKELLNRTSNTQIAVLVISLGALAAYVKSRKSSGAEADFVIGHSVGELAASVAAGSLSIEDAMTLINERGLAMEEAGANNPGGMAAILKMQDELVEAVARSNGAYIANYNIPDQQIVISGEDEPVYATIAGVSAAGGRGIKLPITIPAHTPLMKSAVERVRKVAHEITILDPIIPIVANKTGEIVSKAADLRESLPEQLVSPVRWSQGIEYLHNEGVRQFVEIGPKTVLRDMVRRHLAGKGIVAVNPHHD